MFNNDDLVLVNVPAIGRVLALSPENVQQLKKTKKTHANQ